MGLTAAVASAGSASWPLDRSRRPGRDLGCARLAADSPPAARVVAHIDELPGRGRALGTRPPCLAGERPATGSALPLAARPVPDRHKHRPSNYPGLLSRCRLLGGWHLA